MVSVIVGGVNRLTLYLYFCFQMADASEQRQLNIRHGQLQLTLLYNGNIHIRLCSR